MTIKVAQVFVLDGTPDYAKVFEAAGADIKLTRQMCKTENEIIAVAGDADGVIAAATVQPITPRVLESLHKCRFLQSLGIGFEGVDLAKATELGIMIANVPDYCLDEVSDHTMALILDCTRKTVMLNDAVRSGKWTETAAPYIRQNIWPGLSRLRGQTLGLIGFGRIPQAVVPKAKAFGLRVVAYDPYAPQSVFDTCGVQKVDLNELLAQSDIVSVHAPLTKETAGLMGMAQFRKMKPTACLINTSRGPLIKTDDLYQALTQKVLACAGLDVIEPEPINMDNPILQLPNVIITAHSGGSSPTAMAEMWNRPGEEMINVLVKGQWPRGLVNPQVKKKYAEKWRPL